MLALASQVLPTQYLEEGSLVLVLVGECHMDTPTLAGVAAGVAVWVWVVAWVVDAAGVGLYPIGSRAMS